MTAQAWGLDIRLLVSAVKKLPVVASCPTTRATSWLSHPGKFAGQRAGDGGVLPTSCGEHLTWASAASACTSIPALLLNPPDIHSQDSSKPLCVHEAFSSDPPPGSGYLLACSLSLSAFVLPGDLDKRTDLGSAGLAWGLIFGLSDRQPGDVDGAGPPTPCRPARPHVRPVSTAASW